MKKYNKKRMLIKISFMHYMKWTSVMLPVVFEEFELVCFFAAAVFFVFSIPPATIIKSDVLWFFLGVYRKRSMDLKWVDAVNLRLDNLSWE